jgi:hypothetical protein
LSSNLHLIVACPILQGCGSPMMVPVGQLTLVRTFPKSEPDPGDKLFARLKRADGAEETRQTDIHLG